MKGNVIFISIVLAICATVVYMQHDIDEKRRSCNLLTELLLSTMDYECVKTHYNAYYKAQIHYNYGTINVDSIENDVITKSRKDTERCFHNLFKHFDEKEILEAYNKKTGITLKSKNDFITFHSNIVAEIGINSIADEINIKTLSQSEKCNSK